MSEAAGWIPEILTLDQCDGDWKTLVDRAYETFHRDFVRSQPRFRGAPVRCRRDPIEEDGKEAGFWHCISEGQDEARRTPALRRCERIAWIKAIIENATDPAVDEWENERRGDVRSLLWYQEEFLIVLAQRKRRGNDRYYQLITAYDTPEEHRKGKLRRERDASRND